MRRGVFSSLLYVISALLLSGCVEVCDACLGTDPNKPVPPNLYHKIAFAHEAAPLPQNATNLYYMEHCGIDCVYYAKFQLPHADAIKFAESIRPLIAGTQICRYLVKSEDFKVDWWPPRLSKRAQASCGDINVKDDPYVDIAIDKRANDTVVYIHSWEM